MGRGTSKMGGNSAGVAVSLINTNTGDTIDLTGMPLTYSGDDPAVTGKARQAIDAWETKRAKNKLEYNMSVDQDGNQIGSEVRGGKSRVRVPLSQLQDGAIHTHIHPREESGVLGGTFSDGDLRNFANYGVSTYRARAKEGAYSISKNPNFNKDGFKAYVNSLHAKERATCESSMRDFRKRISSDSNYTYEQYSRDASRAFNGFLVSMHNGLLAGQQQYGYTYTLERR